MNKEDWKKYLEKYTKPKLIKVFYWRTNSPNKILSSDITYEFSNMIVGKIVAINGDQTIIEIYEDYPKIIEGISDGRLMFSYSECNGIIQQLSVIRRD